MRLNITYFIWNWNLLAIRASYLFNMKLINDEIQRSFVYQFDEIFGPTTLDKYWLFSNIFKIQ